MQKLLAVFAATLAFNVMAAAELPGASPQGDAADSRESTTHENVGEKRNKAGNFAEAQRACTSRMQMHSPRGRGAPNWNVYDYCMREQGFGRNQARAR
jgi:cysteinyl-tRNA synthetase